jgi:type I restriction enzyme M protein
MMKNFSVEENMNLEKIKTKLWSILEVFKKENISSDDYHVLLFFLSAYKDGIISADLIDSKHNLNVSLNERLQNSNTELTNQYQSIIHIFEPSMQRLSDIGLKDVFKKIAAINRQVLSDNFTFLFNSVLFRISQSQGKYAGEFIQSVELTRLMCKLVDLERGANVFNPFAGIASFNVFLNRGQNYLGQELDQRTWALGKLRLMAYGRIKNARYDNNDSIYNWPNSSNKYDLIISNPPIGLDLRSHNIGGKFIHTYRRVEQLLIERSIENLSPTGKLITIVPLSFLQRTHGEEHILANLIDNDLIETIILLPGGLLVNTGIPITILVLNKAKKMPGKLKLIDAKKFVVSKGPREKVLDDYALEHFIRSNKEDDSIIRIVDNQQIRLNNYNLSVPRYFRKEIDGIKLGDILEFVRGNKDENWEAAKLIRISDLKDNKVDFTLNASDVLQCEIKQSDSYLISEECLLVAMRGWRLKPTLFELNGETTFKSRDIFSFKINETNVDKAYLVNELHADYVLEQLDAIRGGETPPFISKEDLLDIIIKLPSLNEQKAKVQGIYQLANKFKELQIERNALAHGIKTKQFDEFASLKHTLGTPRQNILGWTKNLSKFFEKENKAVSILNKDFKELFGLRIEEAISEINRDINFISEVLEKGENGLVLTNYPLTFVSLAALNDEVSSITDNGWNFSLKKEILNTEELHSTGLEINLTLFRALMDNILTNAHKYGFTEKKEGNLVQIELIENDGNIMIEVRNNGLPFPKNFDREKFITKYSTADNLNGTGLGGYDIDRIATYFDNSNWELILDNDITCRVIFRFRFPIKLTY